MDPMEWTLLKKSILQGPFIYKKKMFRSSTLPCKRKFILVALAPESKKRCRLH